MNVKRIILVLLVTVAILMCAVPAANAQVTTPELQGSPGDTLTLKLRYEGVYSVELVLDFSDPEYIEEVVVVNSETTLTMADYNAKDRRFGGISPDIVKEVFVTFHIKLAKDMPANREILLTIKEQAIGQDKTTWEPIELPDETITLKIVERLDFSALNQLIDQASRLDESKYTATSWDVLEKALADARKAAADSKTQNEINAAAEVLRDAIKALKELPPPPDIDYSALQKQISIAESLKPADYTADSFAKVTAALTNARSALSAKDQAVVDNAAQSLKSAIADLVRNEDDKDPDYYNLNRQIAIASGLLAERYTAESWDRMQTALKNAKDALSSKEQSVVDAAATALAQAIAALVEYEEPVDLTELKKQLAIAEGLKEINYTESSWSNMLGAAEAARQALTATEQKDVDAAAAALKSAISGLVEMNYQALLDAMNRLQEHIKNEELSALWNEMHLLLNEVEAALSSRDQAKVDDCTVRLLALLVKIEEKLAEIKKPENVIVEKPVPVPPTDDYCNMASHRVWPVLFWISLALNVAGGAFGVVYYMRKRKKTTDDTPLVDYDITDDE